MANVLQIKRSIATPTVPVLQAGELGFTEVRQDELAVGQSTGTNAIIRSLTDTLKTKLDGVETAATADQTGAEIKAAYEGEANTNGFTDAEKSKLAGLEASHFKGTYASLGALDTAHPTASPGDYADVDAGVAADVVRYIWDNDDAAWIEQTAGVGGETAASVKTKYESNADTNAFQDADEAKLDAIEANATADQTATEIEAGLNTNGRKVLTDAEFADAVTNRVTDVGDLSDTPANFTGSAGYLVAVNSGATALEYIASIDGGTF